MKLEPPAEIIEAQDDDLVSYSVICADAQNARVSHAACYSTFLDGGYGRYTDATGIRCYPCAKTNWHPGKKSVLSNVMFTRWMKLCRAHNLIPRDTVEITVKKQTCNFPIESLKKHQIYTALCCYRWSQNQPVIPWTILTILKANPKIHFFQALQYALATHCFQTGHTFLPYNNRDAIAYNLNYRIPNTNFIPAIVANLFLGNDEILRKYNVNFSTIASIEAYWTQLRFIPPEVGNAKKLNAVNADDILWDGWALLFETGPCKDEITLIYDRIVKDRKK